MPGPSSRGTARRGAQSTRRTPARKRPSRNSAPRLRRATAPVQRTECRTHGPRSRSAPLRHPRPALAAHSGEADTLSGQSITCRSDPGALRAIALSLPARHDRRSQLLVVWSINQGNPTPETACRSGRKGLLPLAYLSWSQSAGPQEGEAVLTTWCIDPLLEFHVPGRRSVAGLFHIRQGAMPRRSRLRGSGGKCAGRHTSSPSLAGQWRRLHAKPVPHHLRGARPREGGERKSERCGRCSGIFCNISHNWGRHGGDATSRRRWISNHRDNVRDP